MPRQKGAVLWIKYIENAVWKTSGAEIENEEYIEIKSLRKENPMTDSVKPTEEEFVSGSQSPFTQTCLARTKPKPQTESGVKPDPDDEGCQIAKTEEHLSPQS